MEFKHLIFLAWKVMEFNYWSWKVMENYCAFHKRANCEVQKPTDDSVFPCRQSSSRNTLTGSIVMVCDL